MKKGLIWLVVLLLSGALLTACAGAADETPTLSPVDMAYTQVQQTVQAALTATLQPTEPLTAEPTQQPSLTATAEIISPTPTAEIIVEPTQPPAPTEGLDMPCLQAGFVEDRTIPDGTQLQPGEVFTKTWRLINLGSCIWTPDFKIVFVSGSAMDAAASSPFTGIDIPVGSVADVSVEMTAPAEPGTYRGDWQLQNGSGENFGTVPNNLTFYVEIEVVLADSTPTETLVPTETIEASAEPTATETQLPSETPVPTP